MSSPLVKISSTYNPSTTLVTAGTPYRTYIVGDTLTVSLVDTSGSLTAWTITLVGTDDQTTATSITITQALTPTGSATIQLPSGQACSATFESRINNNPQSRVRFKVIANTNSRALLAFGEVYESSMTTGAIVNTNQLVRKYVSPPNDLVTLGSDCLMHWSPSAANVSIGSTTTLTDSLSTENLTSTAGAGFFANIVNAKPFGFGLQIANNTSIAPTLTGTYATSNAQETYAMTVDIAADPNGSPILLQRFSSGASGAYWGVVASGGRYQLKYVAPGNTQSTLSTLLAIPRRPHLLVLAAYYASQVIILSVDGIKMNSSVTSGMYTTPPTGNLFVGLGGDTTYLHTMSLFDLRYHNAFKPPSNIPLYHQILAESINN